MGGEGEPRTRRGEGNQYNYFTRYLLKQGKQGLQALMLDRCSADVKGPEKSIIFWQCYWRKAFASWKFLYSKKKKRFDFCIETKRLFFVPFSILIAVDNWLKFKIKKSKKTEMLMLK